MGNESMPPAPIAASGQQQCSSSCWLQDRLYLILYASPTGNQPQGR
jgi:hypothetical protein